MNPLVGLVLIIAYFAGAMLFAVHVVPFIAKLFPRISNAIGRIFIWGFIAIVGLGLSSLVVWPALEFFCPVDLQKDTGEIARVCIWNWGSGSV